ncbi:MAG: hypothetical protein WD058_05945 [Dehalococcoidia bacterium]
MTPRTPPDASRPTAGDRDDDPFARIDPFVALADSRRQLVDAIREIEDGALRAQRPDLAETLGIVAAHDRALCDVALAYARGERDFDGVVAPRDRVTHDTTMEVAIEVRVALFDALASIGDALDESLTTAWGGAGTWRMHIVEIAMHEGARAHDLIDAS